MKAENKIHWAILVTGWGRNATDIIQDFHEDAFTNSKLALVVFEGLPCGASAEAAKHNIETKQLKRADFSTANAYQEHLVLLLKEKGIDFVFMLNYKYRIRKAFLKAFPNKILNVHPSLFPSFLGTKTAIQDALDYGVKITGITTHIIDEELDKGTIIAQEPIRIKDGDTFDTLYPQFVTKGRKIIRETILTIEKEYFRDTL